MRSLRSFAANLRCFYYLRTVSINSRARRAASSIWLRETSFSNDSRHARAGSEPNALATLSQAYEKSNRKMLGEWRDANSKGMDFRTLKSLERLEDLYGNLSAEQRNLFKARMSENGFEEQKYQQELRSRQQTVLQTFARLRGADAATAEAALSELSMLFYESADLVYRQHHEQVRAKTCHAFAVLHAQTNADQRSYMVKRLKDYENEVRSLMLQKTD